MEITIIGAGNMARGIATRALSAGNAVALLAPHDRRTRWGWPARSPAPCGPARSATDVQRRRGARHLVPVLDEVLGPIRRTARRQGGRRHHQPGRPADLQPLDVAAGSAVRKIAQSPRRDGRQGVQHHLRRHARRGQVAGQPLDVFVASDDEAAKEHAAPLAEDSGMRFDQCRPALGRTPARSVGYMHIAIQGDLGTSYGSALKIVS